MTRHPSSSALKGLALAGAAFGLAALLTSSAVQDWTADEPWHMQWSRRLIEEPVTERESSSLFNSKTPISIPNVMAKEFARSLGVRGHRRLSFAARLPGARWHLGTLGMRIPVDAASDLLPRLPRRSNAWFLCIDSEGVDLGLRVSEGNLSIGRARESIRRWEYLSPGQVAWFRLAPGLQALGLTGTGGARVTWLLRGGALGSTLSRHASRPGAT